MTLWGGVFQQEPDDTLRKLNDSLPFDWRLYDVDITGSQAWANGLFKADILTEAEHTIIKQGLEQVRTELATAFQNGMFSAAPGDEDIHTVVERRLTELIGPAAGKLHTGRSRNDQVATDLRLWVISIIPELTNQVADLQTALINQAEQHIETLMAGYTHMQPAQPISAAQWLLSFAQMLERDRARLFQVKTATATNPLGSGALAGTPYPIDRQSLTDTLGFLQSSTNSLDAVSDRDYVSGFLYVASLLMVHLSRLSEDIITYSNPAFGFVSLDERYSTGSSLMPQKRNPDPLELARGKTGRIIGHLTGFLTTLKGLPSGYNKDLQEDKEPLFDTYDTLQMILPVMSGVITSMILHPDNMRSSLNETMLATDLADYLVIKGMPFREAHHAAGRIVRLAEEKDVLMSKLPLAAYQSISPLFKQDVYETFDFAAATARRSSAGGTAPESARVQIEKLRESLQDS